MNNKFRAYAHCAWVSALSLCGIPQSSAQPTSPTIVQAQPGPSFEAGHPPNIESAFEKLPMAFEKNQGQADPAVKFLARGPGYQLFLTAQEAVMVFKKGDQATTDDQSAVVRMRFEGASKTPAIAGLAPLAYQTNYFFGAGETQQVTGIANHARVKYASIYPGIDMVLYGNQQQLEYDLVLAPGAKPRQIKLNFTGADKVALSTAGDLVLTTAVGEVAFHKPVAYQEIRGQRKPVAAKYVLADNGRVSFLLGKYDITQPLVIDPILNYSSLVWGSANGIAVDAAGSTYIAGNISTTDLPASSGYQTSLKGTVDAYIVKLDPSGTKVVYATYLGARRAFTEGKGIAVDSSGNAYVFGATDSGSFPVTAGAYQTSATGGSFVTKLNAAGNTLLYSTFVNGATIAAIAADNSGSAYLTGNATALTTTAGAFQTGYSVTTRPFVAKLNASGATMAYATYLAGTQYDVGMPVGASNNSGKSIAVDASGNAYVTGMTVSSNFPTYQAYQAMRSGAQDAFVTKLNATGSGLVYSTYLGGSVDETANGIAVNGAGEAYVAGQTTSDNFPVTAGVFQSRKGYWGYQVSNGFITKLNADGKALVYSSYLGGDWCYRCEAYPDQDAATTVAVDAAGYAYIGGYITSTVFPTTDAIQSIPTLGGYNYRLPFVAKIRPLGNQRVYSVVLGKRQPGNAVNAVAVDDNGSAYAVGHNSTYTTDYPTTAGSFSASGSGYLFKLGTGKFPTTAGSSPNPASSGQIVTLTADVLSAKPGGTVTFMDGTASLGAVSMTNGSAQLAVTLPVGVHKITAVYSEDGKVSPPIFQIVNSK